MESQDSESFDLLKIWESVEANKNRLAGGAIAVIVLILLIWFFSWQRSQKEINAGQAFSQMVVTIPPGLTPTALAADYLKIAGDYAGTAAAQRAQLQGATTLFAAGSYADAQTQFQKFKDAYPGSSLAATAALGIAAAEDAQGQAEAAAAAYRNVLEAYPASAAATCATFAVAEADEQQGKIRDAIKYYQQVERNVPGSSLGNQSAQRVLELQLSLPAVSAASPAAMSPAAPLAK